MFTTQNDALTNLIDTVTEDTELAIRFLVDGFHYDEDDMDEKSCSDLFDLVQEEIEGSTFEEVKRVLPYVTELDQSILDIQEPEVKAEGDIRKPCKNPCPTCPYTKNAAQGYFGGHDGEEYAQAINQDTIIACHSRTKHDDEKGVALTHGDVTVCTGHIVSQIVTCKSTMHPDGKKAQAQIREASNFEELKKNALGFDFRSHHGI